MKKTYQFEVRDVKQRGRFGVTLDRVNFVQKDQNGAEIGLSLMTPSPSGYVVGQEVTLTLETSG